MHRLLILTQVDSSLLAPQGLKMNWEKTHTEYQRLSLVIDTLSKKAHKEQLELAMKKLEKDIDYFERFTIIYIANN